jgi:hypothetical protein
MNRLIATLCCAFSVVACNGEKENLLPTAPTPLRQSLPGRVPEPTPPHAVPPTAIGIAIGQTSVTM